MSTTKATRNLPDQIKTALLGALPSGDAELVEMARQVADIQALIDVNVGRINAADETFDKIRPEMPRALLWRQGDPIGHTARQFDLIENGRRYPWCDTVELSRFNKTRPSDLRHLARLEEIERAFHEHDEADNKAYIDSGLCEAEAENTKLVGQQSEIISRMCQIAPTTLDGHRALAEVFITYCWDGKIAPEGGGMNNKILSAMFSALTGRPVEKREKVQ